MKFYTPNEWNQKQSESTKTYSLNTQSSELNFYTPDEWERKNNPPAPPEPVLNFSQQQPKEELSTFRTGLNFVKSIPSRIDTGMQYLGNKVTNIVNDWEKNNPRLASITVKGLNLTNNGLESFNETEGAKKLQAMGYGMGSMTGNNLLNKALIPETYEKEKQVASERPISTAIGAAIPIIASAVTASSGLSKLPGVSTFRVGEKVAEKFLPTLGLTGKGLLNSIAQGSIKAGLGGATFGLTNGLAEGGIDYAQGKTNSPIDIIKEGAMQSAQNAVGGAVLGGLFPLAGTGLNKFIISPIKNLYGNTVGFNRALGRTSEAIDNYQFPQLRNLKETTQPILPNRASAFTPLQRNFPNRPNSMPVESNLTPLKTEGNINSPLKENEPIRTQPNTNLPINQSNTSNISEAPKISSTFENIKNVNDLPNDVESLSRFVQEQGNKLKYHEENGMKILDIDLQLFAEAKKRLDSLSKVYTNTFEKTDMFNQAEKDILNSAFTNDARSSVKSELESISNAQKRLNKNYDGEVESLLKKELYSGEDVDTLFGILEREKMKARETGDYTKVREIASKGVKEAGREGGRTVQAFAKYSRTPEGKIVEAQRVVDNFADDIMKQNPNIEKSFKGDEGQAFKDLDDLVKARDTVIDDVVKQAESASKSVEKKPKFTNFPKMLKDKIIKTMEPKTQSDSRFIKDMLNDLFTEAKESLPQNPIIKNQSKDIKTLANAYKFRQYSAEIRGRAQSLLKKEFKENPTALNILDNYFNKGFIPPHSKKLLNNILNSRLSGLNSLEGTVNTSTPTNKPNLSVWIKDFYNSGRAERENFIQALINETGLSGDEANSLKNLLDSKLHLSTKQMKDKLLNNLMAPKHPGIIKNATTKLTELTNIGLTKNQKFTNRISEKLSPVVRQALKENNINLNDIVRLSLNEQQAARKTLLNDIFKNTKVSDKDIVGLMQLVNKEFSSLSKQAKENILTNLTKERTATTKKTMVESLREKINLGVYGNDLKSSITDAVKEKYNLPTLSDDEVKFIVDTMDSVKGMPERSEPYLEAMAKVEKLILEKTPASLSQKVASGGFVSMLLNPASQLTNFSGNIGLGVLEQGSNSIRRFYDNALFKSKDFSSGFRTAGKSDANILKQGGFKGARQVTRDMLGGRDFKDLKGKTIREVYDILSNPINTDTSNLAFGDKFEMGNRLAFDNNFGRTLENLTSSGMKIGDLPFNQAYFDDTLNQIMKANNVTQPTEDMLKTAFQVSQERTFKDKNLLSNAAVSLKNLPNIITRNLGKKGEAQRGLVNNLTEIPQIVVNSQIPFAKTPANLIKRGLEYSPAGLVEGAGKLLANKGNMTMMKQREIVDRLTRGTVGTGLLGLGALGYKSDLITSSRDENYNVEKLKQQNGILPDALKIGGKTFDLKKSQPSTTPLIAGSRLAQGKGGDALTTIADSLEGALNQYSDMGMLQSLAKASQLFASSDTARPPDKAKILIDIASTIPKQYVPAVVKKLSYAIDPFERDLSSDSAGQYAVNSIVGKLPGVSKLFPAKVDVYGNKIQSYDGNNSLANTMFNPYLSKNLKNNPVSNEALRLNKSEIDGDMKNSVIPKEVTKDLGDVQLSQEQQNQYQKLMGDKAQSKINELLNNSKYASMSDKDKAIAFSHALDLSRDEAKTEMLKNLGIKSVDEKKKQLIESAEKQKIYGQLKLFKNYK